MISPVERTRVTVQINHRLTHELYDALQELNVNCYYVEQSRMVLLHEKKRRSRMFVTTLSLDESLAERVSFYVGAGQAADIAAALSARFRFDLGGRGALRQESVQSYIALQTAGTGSEEPDESVGNLGGGTARDNLHSLLLRHGQSGRQDRVGTGRLCSVYLPRRWNGHSRSTGVTADNHPRREGSC